MTAPTEQQVEADHKEVCDLIKQIIVENRTPVQEMAGEPVAFVIGDQVEKHTGDYQLLGEVRAAFTTKAGKVRYVVEHDPGFLHIYGPQNLRRRATSEEGCSR